MNGSPIPVTLLTGFLGSGKTTLLNYLLQQVPLTAVLMNEFGEIGLDRELLKATRAPLALLSGGCVCCQVAGALAPTLKNLAMGRADGKLPPFERVIIETTGIADPAPVLDTLRNDRWIAARFQMDAVVTTVDALLGEQQLASHPEARRQAAVADRLVLTKTDRVAPAALAALEARLAEINPAARRITARHGALDPDSVLNLGGFAPARKHADMAGWLAHAAYQQVQAGLLGGTPRPIARADSQHDRIRSFGLSFDEPLAWEDLSRALDRLLASHAKELLRIKAIVNLKGRDRPVALHAVQHVTYPPAELPAWPDENRNSCFVFITDGLDEPFVQKLLQDFTAAAYACALPAALRHPETEKLHDPVAAFGAPRHG